MAAEDREPASFWWADHSAILGLPLAMALCVAIAILYLLPLGPTEQVQGTIVGFGLQETRTGSYPMAIVLVAGHKVAASLPRSNSCQLGSRIGLNRQRRLWGVLFTSDWHACGP